MTRIDESTRAIGRAPHTAAIAAALSNQGWDLADRADLETLLFAVSGGIAFGSFFFHYDGHDPQINLLTRNTFGEYGWDAICSRLQIAQDTRRSTVEAKAEKKLVETLETGRPAIVWLDVFTLGYEHSELGEGMWGVQPVVVEAFDRGVGRVRVVDRSEVAHEVERDVFLEAWGRIKKDRYRMVDLTGPDPDRVANALEQGFADAVRLFFEKPPRGSANNFGHKAYTQLAADVRSVKGKTAWSRTLPTARDLMSGLMTAYKYALLFWKDTSETADRAQFADALELAAPILDRPALGEVAAAFRPIAASWAKIGDVMLPASVPLCAEARSVLRERHALFRREGLAARSELDALDRRRAAILDEAEDLDREALAEAIAELPERLEDIRDREAAALRALAEVIDIPLR